MIEWLSNTFDMRFYYWTGLNWIILFPTYLIGAGLIASLWWWLAKRMRRAWVVIAPLVAVLIVAPWVEELWIAWHFGQLCRKDAGIFVYKTVEVEGFYDATRPTHAGPRTEAAAEDLDRGGYRFYEMVFRDYKGGRNQVVHLEKIKGVWTAAVLDHPTARYHYRWPHMNSPAGHGLQKIERLVLDTKTQEILGRYVDYARESSWFYIGLDRPLRFCKEAERDARARGTVFGPRMVLIPAK